MAHDELPPENIAATTWTAAHIQPKRARHYATRTKRGANYDFGTWLLYLRTVAPAKAPPISGVTTPPGNKPCGI